MKTLDKFSRNQAVLKIQTCTVYYINLHVSIATGFIIEVGTEYKSLESPLKNLHLNVICW